MRALIAIAMALVASACSFDLSQAPRPLAIDGGHELQADVASPDTGAGDVPGEAVGDVQGMELRADVVEVGSETGGEVKPKDAEGEVGGEVSVEAPAEAPVMLKTNGQGCSSGAQCGSGFCVDGVCCSTACDSTMEKACFACNLPGKEGTCSGKCACYSSCGYWSCSAC